MLFEYYSHFQSCRKSRFNFTFPLGHSAVTTNPTCQESDLLSIFHQLILQLLASVNGTCLPIHPSGKLIPWVNEIIHRRDGDKLFQGSHQLDLTTGSEGDVKAQFKDDFHPSCPIPLFSSPTPLFLL